MPSAIDTNVLLRVMINEDSKQGARASARFEAGGLLVSPSVLLETEWVLRSRYNLPNELINRLMSALVGSPHIEFISDASVRKAIVAHGDGMDFADALHLFGASDCEAFLTFDRDLIRRSKKYADAPVARLP